MVKDGQECDHPLDGIMAGESAGAVTAYRCSKCDNYLAIGDDGQLVELE